MLGRFGGSPVEDLDDTRRISRQEIESLPQNATFADAAKLLREYMFRDSAWYDCPAEEGGIYFFSFFPTREIPSSSFVDDSTGETIPTLVAVIKTDSNASLQQGVGEY